MKQDINLKLSRTLITLLVLLFSVNVTWSQNETSYMVSPQVVRQHFDGWGVSLCWWAGQCGKWSDKKIDEIVNWMVSPTGLNYSHFRYNIGGGDDPENRHCDLHHMGKGKGLRAEMEGFKDFSGDEYHWERDESQRKIMLKIKEKRPDAVFEAFSNSSPYYMTYSGCVAGNTNAKKDNLKPEFYEEFANYLVDVCKHYKEEYGIEFKTLEPFNEPYTNYWYANGSQEGCHFDYESQINFIRVLAPILQNSGLNIVISAADETNVGSAVEGFKRFISADADKFIGQWNTHTYSATNVDRARFCQLAHQTGKDLWMSETGEGSNGIAGNLALAQRLIDDMRYIQPEAWIDWQYIEENNDQWCTVRGNFSRQSYQKVKNYYVRQHCTRFIKRGYDIITSLCPQSLAAVNAARDTLVLVALNEGEAITHNIDLSLFSEPPVFSKIRVYRTSETENLQGALSSIRVNGTTLVLSMPAKSITTMVIPIRSEKTDINNLLVDGCDYLIIPRQETTRAISAKDSKVTLENLDYGDAQRWHLTIQDDGTYCFQNALGLRLTSHRYANSTTLSATKKTSGEQNFYIDEVDYPYFKLLATRGRSYGFNLENASSDAGTVINLSLYNDNNTTPTHRQWMLVPLMSSAQTDAVINIKQTPSDIEYPYNQVYDLSGRKIYGLANGIYVKNGRKLCIGN